MCGTFQIRSRNLNAEQLSERNSRNLDHSWNKIDDTDTDDIDYADEDAVDSDLDEADNDPDHACDADDAGEHERDRLTLWLTHLFKIRSLKPNLNIMEMIILFPIFLTVGFIKIWKRRSKKISNWTFSIKFYLFFIFV